MEAVEAAESDHIMEVASMTHRTQNPVKIAFYRIQISHHNVLVVDYDFLKKIWHWRIVHIVDGLRQKIIQILHLMGTVMVVHVSGQMRMRTLIPKDCSDTI